MAWKCGCDEGSSLTWECDCPDCVYLIPKQIEQLEQEHDKALTALEKIQELVHAECTNGIHVRACNYLTDFLATDKEAEA